MISVRCVASGHTKFQVAKRRGKSRSVLLDGEMRLPCVLRPEERERAREVSRLTLISWKQALTHILFLCSSVGDTKTQPVPFDRALVFTSCYLKSAFSGFNQTLAKHQSKERCEQLFIGKLRFSIAITFSFHWILLRAAQ